MVAAVECGNQAVGSAASILPWFLASRRLYRPLCEGVLKDSFRSCGGHHAGFHVPGWRDGGNPDVAATTNAEISSE